MQRNIELQLQALQLMEQKYNFVSTVDLEKLKNKSIIRTLATDNLENKIMKNIVR